MYAQNTCETAAIMYLQKLDTRNSCMHQNVLRVRWELLIEFAQTVSLQCGKLSFNQSQRFEVSA